MIGDLPRSLEVRGETYDIRTDFRDVLKVLAAFNDPNLEENEKTYICLYNIYEDFDALPEDAYEDAFRAALAFIDQNADIDEESKRRPTMDWEQDESLMFPAVNKVAGFETRSAEYIHWWTFIGYYMEISEGVFSEVLNLRAKKARGKKLEKWEREFWDANRNICVLKPRLSDEEQAAKDALLAMIDGTKNKDGD